jgi:SAM-dependent methyltransferase
MGREVERWEKAQSAEKAHSSHHAQVKGYERTFSRYDIGREDLLGSDILAVGAGTGIIHSIDLDCTTVAVDPLTNAFREALENSSAHLITGVGETLPFKNDSFDIILSRNVLDHTIDPMAVIQEVNRLLRQDGTFILDVNVFKLPKPIREQLSTIDTPHPHHFSPGQIVDMVESGDFCLEYLGVEKMDPNWSDPSIKRIAATTIFRIRRLYLKTRPC